MQVVADFRPANTGGLWSLRPACAGALRRSSAATAMATISRRANAVEEGRRRCDELKTLMRPPSLRTPLESRPTRGRARAPLVLGRARAPLVLAWRLLLPPREA